MFSLGLLIATYEFNFHYCIWNFVVKTLASYFYYLIHVVTVIISLSILLQLPLVYFSPLALVDMLYMYRHHLHSKRDFCSCSGRSYLRYFYYFSFYPLICLSLALEDQELRIVFCYYLFSLFWVLNYIHPQEHEVQHLLMSVNSLSSSDWLTRF